MVFDQFSEELSPLCSTTPCFGYWTLDLLCKAACYRFVYLGLVTNEPRIEAIVLRRDRGLRALPRGLTVNQRCRTLVGQARRLLRP
jgi:hypothetical protein